MYQEEHKKSVFVAFLDIMGYKQIVKNNSHEDLKGIYFHNVSTVAVYNRLPQKVVRSEGKNIPIDKAERINVKSIMVSDSIIVWTPDDTNRSFRDILFKVNQLLVDSLFKGIPMRAGICIGPLSFITEEANSIYGQSILLGKPIVDAYEISESQNWSGCIIDEKCITKHEEWEQKRDFNPKATDSLDNLLKKKIILKYKVPKKTGPMKDEFVPNWTLNLDWCRYIEGKRKPFSIEELIRHSFSSLKKNSNEWSVELKILNTINFVQNVSNVDIHHKNRAFCGPTAPPK